MGDKVYAVLKNLKYLNFEVIWLRKFPSYKYYMDRKTYGVGFAAPVADFLADFLHVQAAVGDPSIRVYAAPRPLAPNLIMFLALEFQQHHKLWSII